MSSEIKNNVVTTDKKIYVPPQKKNQIEMQIGDKMTNKKTVKEFNKVKFKTVAGVIEKSTKNDDIKNIIKILNGKYMDILGEKIFVELKFSDDDAKIDIEKDKLTEDQVKELWSRFRISFKSFIRDVIIYKAEDGTPMAYIGYWKVSLKNKEAQEEIQALEDIAKKMDNVYKKKIVIVDSKCVEFNKCKNPWCPKEHAQICWYDGKCTNKDCDKRHIIGQKIQPCKHGKKCKLGKDCHFSHS